MVIQDRFKPLLKFLKITSILASGGIFTAYHVNQVYKKVSKIVNPNVLDVEKKYTPEYIYIDDAMYGITLQKEHKKQCRQTIGLVRIWKSLKHSLAWRLLWLCRHGSKDQRNVALEQLAAFKNSKDWDYLKLAQALDKNTAVLLARTKGADLRYFLPPPIHVRRAAKTPELLSFKLRDMLLTVQNVKPHSCIQHFLSKHFTNVQEQAMEADSIPTKPDSISERDLCLLCLDALHHHLSLFNAKEYAEDISAVALISTGLLPKLAELMLRNHNDVDLDLGVLKILTILSVHCNLLTDFFQNGLIRDLSRLLRSKDIRLASSAAVCLTNLLGEHCYRPGLYLLHPLYRTTTSHSCDTILVHGLRGGVFVTWRQRDKNCAEPIGIVEGTISDINSDSCEEKSNGNNKFYDPELQQVMEDLLELEDEALLAELEVVLHDLPLVAKREPLSPNKYTAANKRTALIQENQDHCNYTFCWPKDWLPKDCNNLRILGINYWSSLSEWLERCPMQTADIGRKAAEMGSMLLDAEVGKKNVPIVWLAHSMGGLIVKQMLIDAAESNNPEFKSLSNSTRAVLFYSTPHKGSALATMPRAAAAVLWPSHDVRQLQENSHMLLDMHKSFLTFADLYGWETISFAETMPTLITAFKVPLHFVETFSADLGRGPFYQLPLDHLSICKPATRQSVLYTTVLDVLLKVTAKDIESKYSNPIIQWLFGMIWWALSQKANEIMESLDETQSSNKLKWLERILLDTFTDGFTD